MGCGADGCLSALVIGQAIGAAAVAWVSGFAAGRVVAWIRMVRNVA